MFANPDITPFWGNFRNGRKSPRTSRSNGCAGSGSDKKPRPTTPMQIKSSGVR